MKALKPRNIDLYDSFFQRQERSASQKKRSRLVALPVCVLALLLGATGLLRYWQWQVDVQAQPVQAYLADAQSIALYAQAQALESTLAARRDVAENLATAADILQGYPRPNEAMLRTMVDSAPDGARFEKLSYDATSGALSASLRVPKVNSPADYAEKLLESGYFERVDYNGYSDTEAKQLVLAAADNEFSFTITAYIRQKEGT